MFIRVLFIILTNGNPLTSSSWEKFKFPVFPCEDMDILQPLIGVYEELEEENIHLLMLGEKTRMENLP